ncbi:MAG: hypothetical protein EA394_01905 [Bacteroidia bacterium]|nr:MAG: hypothetical protein EA394_01905 [Bacteroidia bacterium]
MKDPGKTGVFCFWLVYGLTRPKNHSRPAVVKKFEKEFPGRNKKTSVSLYVMNRKNETEIGPGDGS